MSARNPHLRKTVRFTPALTKAIAREAARRGWSFSKMVRFLCRASIEGIE